MKKTILLLLLAINFNLVAQISNDGLIAYYPLDGDVLDYSSNEHDGAMNGGSFGQDQFGNENAALLLNGIDEFINLTSFGDSFRSNLNQMTIYFKVRFEDEEDQQTILSLGNRGEDLLTNVFEIEYENNRFQVETETGNMGINHELEIDQGASLFTGQWHQIFITIDGENLTYCRDNEVIYQGAYIPAQTTSDNLFLGCFGGTDPDPCCYFGGSIDELQFYNRILTKDEILVNSSDLTLNHTIEFYPNPSSETVTFQSAQQMSSITVTVYDLLGRRLKVEELQNVETFQLRMPEQAGIYLVNLRDQNQNATFRIIKQ
ncbi:MAG: T9SS type A sorting domain-containing protein [Bacteroidota bacterium]